MYSESLQEGGDSSNELELNLEPINHFKDLQTAQLYFATYIRW